MSAPTLSITALLSALHTHLQSQTQLLPTLHAQLGLPPNALEDELTTLHHQLTQCVDSQIVGRQREVDEWMGRCEEVGRYCSRLGKALGGNAKVVSGSVGELQKQMVLPQRHDFLLQYQDKMKQLYQTKLEQLTTLTTRITNLVKTLGYDFYPSDITDLAAAAGEDPTATSALRDVTPERFSRLEKELARGKNEITKRLTQLSETFVQIDWLYTELGIDPSSTEGELTPADIDINPSLLHIPQPFPRTLSVSTPISDDPFGSPTPVSRRSREDAPELIDHNAIFLRFVEQLDASPDGTVDLAALAAQVRFDPTPALVMWASQTASALADLKARRETHIQALFDQLEALWRRLGVPEADMDGFVETHRGSTAETVGEYEAELERMLELKRERMGLFVEGAREEIGRLWDELMTGEEERAAFSPYYDDEFSEDLLTTHEEEITRLREEKRSKAPFLANIRKYFQICDEEKELAAAASDQSRLLGRGPRDPGRLLREEKMRKRVGKEKPRLEQELLTSITAWEEESARVFLVNGVSIVELLSETVAAAADKENKRRTQNQARPGSVPPARATTPSYNPPPPSGGKSNSGTRGNGAITPAVRPGTSMGYGQTGSNKRQRVGEGSVQRSVSHNTNVGRAPLGASRGYHVNSSPPAMHAHHGHHGKTPGTGYLYTKTPGSMATAGSGLPRPAPLSSKTALSNSISNHPQPRTGMGYGPAQAQLGLGFTQSVREQQLKTQRLAARQQRHASGAGAGKRESFRPRPSIETGRYGGYAPTAGYANEEEVF